MTGNNGKQHTQPGAVDPDALRRVEDVIEQLRWTYIREWAPAAMQELEAASRGLRKAAEADDLPAAARHRAAIVRLTHDMRGQAGTFGLDLLQDFAASLHHFAEPETGALLRQAELCEAHVSAMRTALADVSAQPAGTIDAMLERQLREGLRELARMRFN
jgi:HPt (histidine-containing phosphotransfer) domain-containing protein